MPFTFTGEFVVARQPEDVYDFLADAERFCPLLPDFESMIVTDPTHFTVKLKVGISHIRGTATVKMTLEEAERPRRARYSGKGRVVGGNVDLDAGFELEAVPGSTRVHWKGTAQVFGALTSLAGGLLEPLAKKSLQNLIDGLQKALA
jgi:2-furoyl-CoA dehydrogenase large subunit